MIWYGVGYPKPVSLSLGFVLIVGMGIKFWLADFLSSDGFNVEKTTADIALALSTAFCSLAVVQQFDSARIVFPLPFDFVAPDVASATTGTVADAQRMMWYLALASIVAVTGAIWLAHRARVARSNGPAGLFGAGLYRVISVLLGSFTYAIYYVVVLYKA